MLRKQTQRPKCPCKLTSRLTDFDHNGESNSFDSGQSTFSQNVGSPSNLRRGLRVEWIIGVVYKAAALPSI